MFLLGHLSEHHVLYLTQNIYKTINIMLQTVEPVSKAVFDVFKTLRSDGIVTAEISHC